MLQLNYVIHLTNSVRIPSQTPSSLVLEFRVFYCISYV